MKWIGYKSLADITSVTAGTNCSGGGTSGDITINVDDAFLVNDASDTTTGTITAGGFTTTGTWTFDSVALTGIQTSAESFVDDDISLMTSAAIDDRARLVAAALITAEDLDVAADSGTAAVDLDSQSLTVTGGTNITTSATGQAVTVNLDNPIAGPFEIEQGASGGGAALLVDNNDVDQVAIDIEAANTTVTALRVKVPDLTSANAIYVNADSLTTGAGIKLDVDDALTTSATKSLSVIDYDKAGVTASGQTSITTGLNINLADAATNNAAGTVKMYGIQVDVDSANAQGSIHQTGLNMNVAADGVADAGNTVGIDMTVVDGGYDVLMRSHAEAADFCAIRTTTNGATTISTSDGSGAAAHFDIAANGNITLDASGDIALECGGGDLTCDADTVTFSSANADDPNVIIKNTTNDNQAARLSFMKDRDAAMADSDRIAELDFYGEDASENLQQYGKMMVQALESDHGSETGRMQWLVAEYDGTLGVGLKIEGGTADGVIDAVVGLGTASTTTIAGDLTVTGSDLTFDSVALTAVQTSAESFVDNDTSIMTSAAAKDAFASRAYFQFKGYGTSDGTNYDMQQEMTDNQAPFQHDTNTGSDGLTAQTTTTILRSGGKVMPYAGVLKKFTGWAASQGSGSIDVGIFKFTPVDNDASNVSAVLLINTQVTAAGNTKMRSFTEDSFDIAFAAGDILYSAVNGGTAAKLWYMDSTLEVEWT